MDPGLLFHAVCVNPSRVHSGGEWHVLIPDPRFLTLMFRSAYMEFIFERLRNKNPDGSLQIMYTIHGKHPPLISSLLTRIVRSAGGKDLEEIELTHLDGHKGSKPVRIGNGAADHVQLVCSHAVFCSSSQFHWSSRIFMASCGSSFGQHAVLCS